MAPSFMSFFLAWRPICVSLEALMVFAKSLLRLSSNSLRDMCATRDQKHCQKDWVRCLWMIKKTYLASLRRTRVWLSSSIVDPIMQHCSEHYFFASYSVQQNCFANFTNAQMRPDWWLGRGWLRFIEHFRADWFSVPVIKPSFDYFWHSRLNSSLL